MEITIKKLTECTFAEAVDVWNKSFEGYFANMNLTVDKYAARFGLEGLSPSLSIVGYVDREPVGMVLSGVKMINGKKVAWNGGTGVVTKFRGKGLGQTLMEAVLNVYREEKVDISTLEALDKNEKAIALYKRKGYEIADRLLFLEKQGPLEPHAFQTEGEGDYKAIYGAAQEAGTLPFYQHNAPWQTQCTGIRDGQAMIIENSTGEAIGYSLFKRTYDDDGTVKSISLYQCHVKDGTAEPEQAITFMLNRLFAPHDYDCKRTTFNFSAANEKVVRVLEAAGFTQSMSQVYMVQKW